MTGATAGMAAGALTGAGIAALSGDDILMGGVSGGLGGYGGGGLGAANSAAKLTAAQAMGSAPLNSSINAAAGYTGPASMMRSGAIGGMPTAGTGIGGLTQSQAAIANPMGQAGKVGFNNGVLPSANSPAFAGEGGYSYTAEDLSGGITPEFGKDYGFKEVFTELGGGNFNADGTANSNAMYKGAGKAGLTALPLITAATQPEPGPGYEDDPMNKYDPNRTLDLSMDTGIDAALKKDSGLRLLAEGGYLSGPGDGMSDDIPATINGNEPAALADGEFVVPADVVSHLGNGSSNAGSKKLYEMMAQLRKDRTGTEKQGKEINPERYIPA